VSDVQTSRSHAAPTLHLNYRPQLDALRALAVAAVVFQHALPATGKTFPFAHAGVRLFFVLSGYLITSLLLHFRDASRDVGRWKSLGEFYLRRCLRIWPLYFLVITLALAFDVGPVREVFPWLLTHTVNFCVAVRGEWIDAFFHFWTLSVEEQFYLVWPFVVLFAPRRSLSAIALLNFAIGPMFRAISVVNHWGVYWTYCPTLAAFDTLGAGSLVAILCHDARLAKSVDRGLSIFALPVGLAGIVVLRVLHYVGVTWPNEVLFDTALALTFAWLVRSAACGFAGWAGKALELKPIVYVGKISYGVYVYHVILPFLLIAALNWLFNKYELDRSFFDSRRQRAFLGIALLVVPIISWHLFEKPINGLKDIFGRRSRNEAIPSNKLWNRGLATLAVWVGILLATGTSEALGFCRGTINRAFYERREQDDGSEASPTVYYVNLEGDDNNPGTAPSRAWRTLDRISRTSFGPGDSILLAGGQTFSGCISLDRDDASTPSRPISIGSYGDERATIDAGDGCGVLVRNTMAVHVRDLIVRGAGAKANHGSGIAFENDLDGPIKLPDIRVEHVEASGFGKYGIVVCGKRRKSGYRDVRITDASTHDNALAGIYVCGVFSRYSREYAHQDVHIVSCTSYFNSGIMGSQRENSGSGIVMSDVDGGAIESCVAHDNGRLCDSVKGGPVGIWVWDANHVSIQHNESYRNHTGGTKDGGGFDFDGGVTNSHLQYNYSHDNDGAGYMLCQFADARRFAGNTIRFNISQNDGRKNVFGAIHFHDENFCCGIANCQVYNNTVYVTPSAEGDPSAVFANHSSIAGVSIRNNILQSSGGPALIAVLPGQEALTFQGNSYYAGGGDLGVQWEDRAYSSLEAWREATSQERISGKNVGYSVDPRLRAPGSGGTVGSVFLLASLDAYRLRDDSPLSASGLDLIALFGIDPGQTDFFGETLRQKGALPIGAHAPGRKLSQLNPRP
jgi:peptidoglycan/LPS O-acetylase OafA/YrhL